MPLIIKQITATFLSNYSSDLTIVGLIQTSINQSDYIKVNGFTGYLQNFININSLIQNKIQLTYGLNNQYKLPVSNIQLSY